MQQTQLSILSILRDRDIKNETPEEKAIREKNEEVLIAMKATFKDPVLKKRFEGLLKSMGIKVADTKRKMKAMLKEGIVLSNLEDYGVLQDFLMQGILDQQGEVLRSILALAEARATKSSGSQEKTYESARGRIRGFSYSLDSTLSNLWFVIRLDFVNI